MITIVILYTSGNRKKMVFDEVPDAGKWLIEDSYFENENVKKVTWERS